MYYNVTNRMVNLKKNIAEDTNIVIYIYIFERCVEARVIHS